MEEKKQRRIKRQKHSSIWMLVIVIVIAILAITSLFIDNKKFENSVNEKKKLEQEIEKLKQENKEKELREKQEEEKQKALQEEEKKKEEIEKNISEENKENVKKIKEEIKEINSKNNKVNKTQKELSQDMQKVIDKSSEKWNVSEKDRATNAVEIVKKHLGNADYAYNLMDKVNDNIYMVVVLDNNTREVIGYYYSDIEKNIAVKEE